MPMKTIFILIDILILAILLGAMILIIYLWKKKDPLNTGSLSVFRNDDIYEKCLEEQKKLAHIEDSVNEETPEDIIPDESDDVSSENIFFADGYGELDVEGKNND